MSNEILSEIRQILLNVHGLDCFASGTSLVGKITAILPPFVRRGQAPNPAAPVMRIRVDTDYGQTTVGIFIDDTLAITELLALTQPELQEQVKQLKLRAKSQRNVSKAVPDYVLAQVVITRSGRYWNFFAPYEAGMAIDEPNFFPENSYAPKGAPAPNDPWGTPAPSTTGQPETTTETATPPTQDGWGAPAASPSEGWT